MLLSLTNSKPVAFSKALIWFYKDLRQLLFLSFWVKLSLESLNLKGAEKTWLDSPVKNFFLMSVKLDSPAEKSFLNSGLTSKATWQWTHHLSYVWFGSYRKGKFGKINCQPHLEEFKGFWELSQLYNLINRLLDAQGS